MKEIIKQWKKGNYNFVYEQLKKKDFEYTLDNLERNFSSINSQDKYCYFIYLLSKENTPRNTILLCDVLLYTDTFFYDVNPVIRMFLQQSLNLYPFDISIISWILDTYDNNLDSPFSSAEINLYKSKLDNNY